MPFSKNFFHRAPDPQLLTPDLAAALRSLQLVTQAAIRAAKENDGVRRDLSEIALRVSAMLQRDVIVPTPPQTLTILEE